jgi:hypothetical protein
MRHAGSLFDVNSGFAYCGLNLLSNHLQFRVSLRELLKFFRAPLRLSPFDVSAGSNCL